MYNSNYFRTKAIQKSDIEEANYKCFLYVIQNNQERIVLNLNDLSSIYYSTYRYSS